MSVIEMLSHLRKSRCNFEGPVRVLDYPDTHNTTTLHTINQQAKYNKTTRPARQQIRTNVIEVKVTRVRRITGTCAGAVSYDHLL